jgi:flagellar biosynthesis protein FliR
MIRVTDTQLYAWLALMLWPLARILGVVAVAPVLGDPSVPQTTKIGISLLLTAALAPALPAMPAVSPGSLQGLAILAQQVLIGVSIGFCIRLVFAAVEAAGEIIGLQMGLGFATLYDPQNATSESSLSTLLNVLAVLIFLAMDGHLTLFGTLVESFRLLPVDAQPLAAASMATLARAGGGILLAGGMLALPVVAALLIANIALGVLTRAAPQLNLFAVGFPVTLGVGIVLLSVTMPWLAPTVASMLEHGATNAGEFLRAAVPR